MTQVNPNSPAEVAVELARLSNTLEERTEDYAASIQEAAWKEAAFKRVFAIALVAIADSGVKMPVAEKEARATVETSDEMRAYLISAATAKSVKESLNAISTQIHALQTLASTLRHQT